MVCSFAEVTLNGLLSWLVGARYLAGNPMELTRRRRRSIASNERPFRHLGVGAWLFLLDSLERMPAETPDQCMAKSRGRHIFAWLYMTAARLSELASATMGSVRQQDDGTWWWHVLGKGAKQAMVPVTPDLMESLAAYREDCGLSPLPAPGEAGPLVMRLRPPKGGGACLSDSAIYGIVKQAFKAASVEAQVAGQLDVAARLERASTHWMRHTSLTHQLDSGIALVVVRDNARHANIATTSRYRWSDQRGRYDQTAFKHNLIAPSRSRT